MDTGTTKSNDQYIILLKLDEKTNIWLGTSQTGIQVLERFRRRKRMNELITGLNGGNVPALDIIMLFTSHSIASFHCGYDEFLYAYYNHTFFHEIQ